MKATRFNIPDVDTVINQIFADQHEDAKLIKELKESNATKDSTILMASIQITDLQKENIRLSGISETMKEFLCKFLDAFEGRFNYFNYFHDTKDPAFTEEEYREYITAAKFMEDNFSRPNYVYAVEEYLKTFVVMKPKQLKFEKCFFVDTWATGIVSGMGAEIRYKKDFMEYNDVLFYPDEDLAMDKIPMMKRSDMVFKEISRAEHQLSKEKEDYIKFLVKQRDDATRKLNKM